MEAAGLGDVDFSAEQFLEVLHETELIKCGRARIEFYQEIQVALRSCGSPGHGPKDARIPRSSRA